MMAKASLKWLAEELATRFGPVPAPFPTDPFELILWENVAYLADDERRRRALEELRARVGTRPDQILRATPDDLLAVSSHGILAETFAVKLRAAAEIALGEFEGDLADVLARPPAAAKRALRKFPGIGEPGADKVLLFTRTHPSLAPESNGLRVLVRLGLVSDGKNYSVTYRAARSLAQDEVGTDFDRLLATRHYLRQLGRELCRNKSPHCEVCPLKRRCPTA